MLFVVLIYLRVREGVGDWEELIYLEDLPISQWRRGDLTKEEVSPWSR